MMNKTEFYIDLQARRLEAKIQTLTSPKINPVDLAKLLLNAGFNREEAITMLAIAGAESGYRVKAKNVDKNHGSEDYGIYQINQIHEPDMKRIYDPAYNVELAKKIYDRQGFSAWVAWDNNKHLPFMKNALDAVNEALIDEETRGNNSGSDGPTPENPSPPSRS